MTILRFSETKTYTVDATPTGNYEHHCVDCTTGQTTQTLKYLFRVLQGELSLILESGAEDALQDNRTK